MDNLNGSLNPWMIPLTLGERRWQALSLARCLVTVAVGLKPFSSSSPTTLKEGPLAGSWIDYQPIPFQRFAYKTTAYRGGLRRQEDDQLVNYEFLADAYTGSIIELKRMN